MNLRNTLFAALLALVPATTATAQCGGSTVVGTSCHGYDLSCFGTGFQVGATVTVQGALASPGNLAFFMIGSGAPFPPADLTTLGAPGCFLYVNPLTTFSAMLVGDGFADLVIDIPNNPALAGTQLSMQGAAVQPGVNPLGLVLSNGLAITIQ